ncbi:MAG: amino acid permease [Candidatus Protochlamydia sp.]|nr:amino acid permease [Candidatus Protochlamydia sp.]
MYKKIGAIFLVAGTCIGSGMIALPMVLAKLGIVPSMLLMLAIWSIMYYTSLINLELNLQAKHGLSLGELGKRFSGKTAELIGTVSLKVLSYSLLAVFIYGGASIVQELIDSKLGIDFSFESIASWYALMAVGLLLLPIKQIDYFNRLLFITLLGVVVLLIVGLVVSIEWTHLPLFSQHYLEPSAWASVIPVVFTSFGFQVIFHTLTNYCHKDARLLKRAFFWGSLIPAIVYILWSCSILSVVYHNNSSFYVQMAEGNTEVGELIEALSGVAQWQSVQLLVWWISLLAIATSVLGVGVGLCDSLKKMMSSRVSNANQLSLLASILTIVPAYLIVILIPNAFIAVLGFAGMILAIIAIILPTWLFWQIKPLKLHYEELNAKWLIHLSFAAAVGVIVCELWNMLAR